METLKKIFEAIAFPFTAIAVLIDESRRINEGGTWDKYNARKNRRASRKGR